MAAGNSIWDEVREQQRKLKGRPFKEKLAYFWEYYKIHTLVILCVLFFGGNLIYTIATAKDPALEVAFVNTYLPDNTDTDALSDAFLAYAGIDSKDLEAVFQTDMTINYERVDEMSYANIQKIMANIAGSALDVIVCDRTYLESVAQEGMFANLEDVFPKDLLERYADRLIYMDLPEDDAGEVPVAIDVVDSPLLWEGHETACFTVIINTTRPDTAVQFFRFMMES